MTEIAAAVATAIATALIAWYREHSKAKKFTEAQERIARLERELIAAGVDLDYKRAGDTKTDQEIIALVTGNSRARVIQLKDWVKG